MILKEILSHVEMLDSHGDLNCDISGIDIDSRQVSENHLFVAVKGTQTDGHAFIEKAVAQGARAVVVCEDFPTNMPENVTFVRVANTEQVVGVLATTFYSDPTGRFVKDSSTSASDVAQNAATAEGETNSKSAFETRGSHGHQW